MPRLEVGPADDGFERQADAVATRVMAAGGGSSAASMSDRAGPMVQRRCGCGSESEPVMEPHRSPVRRAAADPVDEIEDDGATARMRPGAGPAGGTIAASATQLTSGGTPLSGPSRAFFEPRLGADLGRVRLHRGEGAARLARSIGARAFTYRDHVWLGDGESDGPGFTLAHELAHVLQQTGSDGPVPRRIQRLVHGPSTPTNCHNWRIPLPPWTAGSLAHLQAAFYFALNPGTAGRILPEVTMPRGTKIAMGIPNPPSITPPGFIDLVGLQAAAVEIGEIKSTASAALATPQAVHYMTRHAEWLSRAPWSDTLDLAYNAVIGGPKSGGLMSGLASVTGSGIAVGPFIGDPLKTFHLEADTAGAIVYWCTGVGTTNPAWALAFKRAMKAIMDAFWEAYRVIKGAIDDLLDWVGDNPVLAFAILLCLVIIGVIIAIIAGVLEVPSLGTSTPALVGGLALALTAGVAMLALIGIDTGDFGPAAEDMVAALSNMSEADEGSAEAYERDADSDTEKWTTADASAPAKDFEETFDTFVAAAGTLPSSIGDYALDVLNPFSSTTLPQPTEDRIATARGAAQRLAGNPDTKIATLGQEAVDIANRIVV